MEKVHKDIKIEERVSERLVITNKFIFPTLFPCLNALFSYIRQGGSVRITEIVVVLFPILLIAGNYLCVCLFEFSMKMM